MTNDEIKLKIAGHLSTHSYEVGSNILPLVDLVQILVAQAIREAKIEAYEEAMKADCIDCQRGLPVELRAGLYYHLHPEVNDESLCEVSGARGLRDSLVETVPS
jgi:hypothetical protein